MEKLSQTNKKVSFTIVGILLLLLACCMLNKHIDSPDFYSLNYVISSILFEAIGAACFFMAGRKISILSIAVVSFLTVFCVLDKGSFKSKVTLSYFGYSTICLFYFIEAGAYCILSSILLFMKRIQWANKQIFACYSIATLVLISVMFAKLEEWIEYAGYVTYITDDIIIRVIFFSLICCISIYKSNILLRKTFIMLTIGMVIGMFALKSGSLLCILFFGLISAILLFFSGLQLLAFVVSRAANKTAKSLGASDETANEIGQFAGYAAARVAGAVIAVDVAKNISDSLGNAAAAAATVSPDVVTATPDILSDSLLTPDSVGVDVTSGTTLDMDTTQMTDISNNYTDYGNNRLNDIVAINTPETSVNITDSLSQPAGSININNDGSVELINSDMQSVGHIYPSGDLLNAMNMPSGHVEGNNIMDANGELAYTIDGNNIFDKFHQLAFTIQDGNIFNNLNQLVGTTK